MLWCALGVFWGYSGGVLGRSGLFYDMLRRVLACSSVFWRVLVCSGVFVGVLGCSMIC
jgi:hypothetical protein